MAARHKRKSAVSFGRYIYLKNRDPQNQKSEGQLSRRALTNKGQIFLITSSLSDVKPRKAGDVEMTANIIREVYYSHPSADIVESLNRAFQDANTLVNELLNDKTPKQRSGIKCTAFVLTRERGYLAQVGDNHLYRITSQKIDRLTGDTNIVGGKKSFALGLENEINVHFNRYIALTAGDAYLLGAEELPDFEPDLVKQIVSQNSPQHAGHKLFDLIAEKSAKDAIEVQFLTINLPLQKSAGAPATIWRRKRIWLSAVLLFLMMATAPFILFDKRVVHESEVEMQPSSPTSPAQTPQIIPEDTPAERVQVDDADTVIAAKIQAPQTTSKPPIKTAQVSQPADLPVKQIPTTRTNPESNIKPFSAKWNLQNLTEFDYQISADKLIFLSTPNLKKALYRSEPLSNFSVSVEARILNNAAAGRFGVMVGYQAMESSPYEVYYLLSLFRQKEFLLQKYSGFRKELVTRIPITLAAVADNYQTIRFKVMCSGPFIELTANQRQVFRWRTGEEIVKGNIGVFVSPDTEVELSRFEVSDTSVLSRK